MLARDALTIEVSFDSLNEEDLLRLEADAYELGDRAFGRERELVAGAYLGLSDLARAALEEREGTGYQPGASTWWTLPVAFDPTANLEHNKDDLAAVMAPAMALAERVKGDILYAYFWFSLISHLARERDRLRRAGSIL